MHGPAALAVLAIPAIGYAAYACAAIVRFDALAEPPRLVAAVVVLAILGVSAKTWPFGATLVLIASLPLFGNHPGGRFIELLNLPLAASAAGLAAIARRDRRPMPDNAIWRAAFLYLLTALVALVPVLPRMAARAWQIDHPLLFVAEALTAAEDDVLYAVSSVTLVTLAVVWAYSLAWAGVTERFVLRAGNTLTAALLVVTGIGLLDWWGLTAIGRWYVLTMDPRAVHFVGLQSIFWHPGWFAWYFVLAFGIAVGLWMNGSLARGAPMGIAMTLCYLAFLLNPERGGLVAVHGIVGIAAWHAYRRPAPARRSTGRFVAAAAAVVVVAVLSLGTSAGRSAVARAGFLSLERTANNASDFLRSDATDNFRGSERLKLWSAAIRMWARAPLFGAGEGSFAWRFHEVVPTGSTLDTPTFADAHSQWFQLLATRGLAGVAAFGALVATVVAALRRRRDDAAGGGGTLALVLALAGFLIYSMVYALFYLQPIQLLFWLVIAFAAASPTPAADRGASRFAWWVAGGVSAAVAFQVVWIRPLAAQSRATLGREPRGFYPIEIGPEGARKRWSSAAGVLCLNPTGPHAELRFEAVDPRVGVLARRVTLALDGQPVDRFEMRTTDVVIRHIEMPPPFAAAGTARFGECTAATHRLSVAVDRTWSPADIGFNADPRHLGVLVFEPLYGGAP